jgi:hypothetical protein
LYVLPAVVLLKGKKEKSNTTRKRLHLLKGYLHRMLHLHHHQPDYSIQKTWFTK